MENKYPCIIRAKQDLSMGASKMKQITKLRLTQFDIENFRANIALYELEVYGQK
ncbi:hypothetical protein ACFL3G_10265 [Planctomycetota bacterium]